MTRPANDPLLGPRRKKSTWYAPVLACIATIILILAAGPSNDMPNPIPDTYSVAMFAASVLGYSLPASLLTFAIMYGAFVAWRNPGRGPLYFVIILTVSVLITSLSQIGSNVIAARTAIHDYVAVENRDIDAFNEGAKQANLGVGAAQFRADPGFAKLQQRAATMRVLVDQRISDNDRRIAETRKVLVDHAPGSMAYFNKELVDSPSAFGAKWRAQAHVWAAVEAICIYVGERRQRIHALKGALGFENDADLAGFNERVARLKAANAEDTAADSHPNRL
jgi:hypothetical protein